MLRIFRWWHWIFANLAVIIAMAPESADFQLSDWPQSAMHLTKHAEPVEPYKAIQNNVYLEYAGDTPPLA